MIEFCNCKINLGLSVLDKRPDGYHNLETVFYPLNLCDVLEVMEGSNEQDKKVRIISEGLPIPGDQQNNLIAKAYHLLDLKFSLNPVTFHLIKKIPIGAGLGGGSSDGAYALKLLNRLFKLNLSVEQLIDYAAKLGSDCPFFIENIPCFASGRGEILSKIKLDLSSFCMVLIKPEVHVSTADAFNKITSLGRKTSNSSLLEVIQMPIESWRENLINDFEKSVFEIYPQIKEIKDKLYREGAIYSSMSGSGSAVFGIFRYSPGLANQFPGCSYFEV